MSVVFIPRTLQANVLEGQSNQFGRGFEEGQAENCTKETLAKWINVLGGADVFTFSHCWLAQEQIRIDF